MAKTAYSIEFLRFLAVSLVVLGHAGILPVNSFVGVDIFFIISGFLMYFTSTYNGAAFSKLNFYKKRILRLLPEIFLVAITVVAIEVIFGVNKFSIDWFQSIIATLFTVSNYLFSYEIDYFAPGADSKIFLHLWSLCVELHFYLVFPLIFKQNKFAIIVFIISFLIWIFTYFYNETFNYYDSIGRIWEFITGIIAAKIILENNNNAFSKYRGFINLVFVFTLLIMLLFVENSTIVVITSVTIVTFLFILSNYNSWNSNIRTVTFVSNISYSLYLWHLPVIIYFKQITGDHLGLFDLVIILPVLFLVSFVSNQYRLFFSKHLNRWVYVFAHWLVLLVGTNVALSLNTTVNQDDTREFFQYLNENYEVCPEKYLTEMSIFQKYEDKPRCFGRNELSGKITFIIGDSHAEAWFPAITEYVEGSIYYLLLDNEASRSAFIRYIEENAHVVDHIYMSYFWSLKQNLVISDEFQGFLSQLDNYVDRLTVIGQVPWLKFEPGFCKTRFIYSCDRFPESLVQGADLSILELLPADYDYIIPSLACVDDYCSVYTQANELMYRDTNHLTVAGSRELFGEAFKRE